MTDRKMNMEKDPKSKLIEQLLEEIDELKEQSNVREMKLETLNFRCEKLQEDITRKHEQISGLKNSVLDQNEHIQTISSKLEKAEKENKMNRENIAPRLDSLKSRYEVCMLEMVSLENDNKILNERVNRLLKENSELRKQNRGLKREKFEEKQERLELCRDFEKVKREFEELLDQLTDMSLEKQELEEANKRIKNERDTYLKKLEILERENYRLSEMPNIKAAISIKGNPTRMFSNSFEQPNEIEKRVNSKETVYMNTPKNYFEQTEPVNIKAFSGKYKYYYHYFYYYYYFI